MSFDMIARIIFLASGAALMLIIGAVTADRNYPPGVQIKYQANFVEETIRSLIEPQAILDIEGPGPKVQTFQADRMQPGLTMIGAVGADARNAVTVYDASGTEVHKWAIDWFEIWPDAHDTTLPKERLPARQPGVVIHGILATEDGGLIFNFEYLSTVRLNACGEVVWRLPNTGHHFATADYDGDIWVGTAITHRRYREFPHANFRLPMREDAIVELSPEGEVKHQVSMIDLFAKNDLYGLMFVRANELFGTKTGGDIFHLNDAEMFPEDMEEGFFKRGDMIISPRNTNTVMVIDPRTMTVKHRVTGRFVRQHDPDFTSGNSYIVFDNNNRYQEKTHHGARRSRVVEVTVDDTGHVVGFEEMFRGPEAEDFFTRIMGAQQLLDNGNGLIVSSFEGRVLELDPEGRLVWEFRNVIGDNLRGAIMDAERLPARFTSDFFAEARAACGASR